MICKRFIGQTANPIMMRVLLTDDGQRIGPANAAQSQIESVRLRAAYPPELGGVPAERERDTADDHADGCGV